MRSPSQRSSGSGCIFRGQRTLGPVGFRSRGFRALQLLKGIDSADIKLCNYFLLALESASLMRCSDLHIHLQGVSKGLRNWWLSQCREASGNPRRGRENDHQAGRLVFVWAPVCLSDEVVTGTDSRGYKVKPDTLCLWLCLGYIFFSLSHW